METKGKEAMKTLEDLEEELCDHCPLTEYGTVSTNTGSHNLCEGMQCGTAYENYLESEKEEEVKPKKVIFNNPATIVIWEDNTKTIVKCNKNDKFKKKAGYLMAYFQKTSGMTKHQCSKFLKELKTQ